MERQGSGRPVRPHASVALSVHEMVLDAAARAAAYNVPSSQRASAFNPVAPGAPSYPEISNFSMLAQFGHLFPQVSPGSLSGGLGADFASGEGARLLALQQAQQFQQAQQLQQAAAAQEALQAASAPGRGRTKSSDSRSSSAYASRHQAAEQRRRHRINDRLENLRRVVPHSERANTAAFLEEVIKYVEAMQARVTELETALNIPHTCQPRQNISTPTIPPQWPQPRSLSQPASSAPPTANTITKPSSQGVPPVSEDARGGCEKDAELQEVSKERPETPPLGGAAGNGGVVSGVQLAHTPANSGGESSAKKPRMSTESL